MAAISTGNATILADEGGGERAVLYRIKGANTTDTFDVAAQFGEVKSATFLAAGSLATVGTASAVGTVITLTLATMASDNIYLLVLGQRT